MTNPTTNLRALTIRQPYAEAITRGVKVWETRGHRTLYRGPMAVHAAAQWEPGWRNVWVHPDRSAAWEIDRHDILVEQLGLEPVEDTVNGPGQWSTWDRRPLPTGAVVAVADLTDCAPIAHDSETGIDTDASDLDAVISVNDAGTQLDLWTQTAAGPHGYDEWEHHDITDQLALGHWTPGGWAWRLENVVRLPEPVPAKGRLGLWNTHGYPLPGDPDGDLEAEVLRALGR